MPLQGQRAKQQLTDMPGISHQFQEATQFVCDFRDKLRGQLVSALAYMDQEGMGYKWARESSGITVDNFSTQWSCDTQNYQSLSLFRHQYKTRGQRLLARPIINRKKCSHKMLLIQLSQLAQDRHQHHADQSVSKNPPTGSPTMSLCECDQPGIVSLFVV